MKPALILTLSAVIGSQGCSVKRLNLGADRADGGEGDGSAPAESASDSGMILDVSASGPRVQIAATTRVFLAPEASCALDSAGNVACIGTGPRGQLAVAPGYFESMCAGRLCTYRPQEAIFYQALDISLSARFGCAAIGDGVFCFGENDLAQLGRGNIDADAHFVPDYVTRSGWDPQRVTLGHSHACALNLDRTVDCWGFGGHGQLGVDPSTLASCGTVNNASVANELGLKVGTVIACAQTPVRAFGIIDAIAVAAGGHGTCVVRATGEMRCFGRNQNGSLGMGPDADVLTPKPSTLGNVAEVFLSAKHGCAITRDRHVHCWGSNSHGQLAVQSAAESCAGGVCVRVPEETAFRFADGIALGAEITFVLRQDARVFAVGSDSDGQLGDGAGARDRCGADACTKTPVEVALPSGAFTIAAGRAHACAVLEGNRIMCWGRGSEGQTGSSFFESSDRPVDVDLDAPEE